MSVFRVGTIVGVDADTDARGDVKLLAVDGMNLAQRLQNSSCGYGGVLGAVYVLQQYGELIAAVPADRIRVAYACQQAFCDRLKKLVASRVSQRVVDLFEPSKSRNRTAAWPLCRRASEIAWPTRSLKSNRLGKPVRESCSAR